MRFKGTVFLAGKTATGIQVPDELVAALGKGNRPPVKVTIGPHSFRTTVAPMGGEFWIPLSAKNREAAGVAAGDDVDVEIELDLAPREVEVPADLAALLNDDTKAAGFFEGLSYSNQRAYVLWVESAKKAETRERRLEQTMEMLRDGKTR